jgi:hypothetical protein
LQLLHQVYGGSSMKRDLYRSIVRLYGYKRGISLGVYFFK